MVAAGVEGELRDGGRRNTSASVGVTLETAVAAAISAGIRAWVRREVTVATTPDATSLPAIGYNKACEGKLLENPSKRVSTVIRKA